MIDTLSLLGYKDYEKKRKKYAIGEPITEQEVAAKQFYRKLVGYKHRNLKRTCWASSGRVCVAGGGCGVLPAAPRRAWLVQQD